MKAKDIRDMTVQEIEERIREEERDLSSLSFKHAVADLEDPLVLRRKRRDLARMKTILQQKQG